MAIKILTILQPFDKNYRIFIPSLFYYCLMTSAGGNVLFVSWVKQVKKPPAESKYFRRFFIGKLRIFLPSFTWYSRRR